MLIESVFLLVMISQPETISSTSRLGAENSSGIVEDRETADAIVDEYVPDEEGSLTPPLDMVIIQAPIYRCRIRQERPPP